MNKYILLLGLMLGVIACSSDPTCEQEYDVPFEVKQGEAYCFSDGSKLTINEFSVSYCPCNVDCFWEGETAIIATWTDTEGDIEEITIHEVLTDQNPSWAKIHALSKSEDCEPVLQKVSVVISEKTMSENCSRQVVIDKDLYENAPDDDATIISATITGDCLNIRFAASGCSGDSWKLNLYDAAAIAESSPEQRYIRLSLENPEECLAVFEKELSFDISPLQIQDNGGAVLLNLVNNDQQIRYEY